MHNFISGTIYKLKVNANAQIIWAGGGATSADVPWIFKSTDKGETWQSFIPPHKGEGEFCYSMALHPDSADIVYAGLEYAVVKTTDGGQTWFRTGLQDVPVRFTGLVVDRYNHDHLWAAGVRRESTHSLLWQSFDAGANWEGIEIPQNIKDIAALVQDPSQKDLLYLGTRRRGVWRYRGQAPSTSEYFPLQVGNQWHFAISELATPIDTLTETIIDTTRLDNKLYYVFDQFYPFRNVALRMTEDSKLLLRDSLQQEQVWLDFSAAVGDSWRVAAPGGGSDRWTVSLSSKTDTVAALSGLFTNCYRFDFTGEYPDNSRTEWYADGIGPVQRISFGAIVYHYQLVRAHIHGQDFPTSIRSRLKGATMAFHLYQNYPNPFNESTWIPYHLARRSFVTLEIYNIRGQKVRTLVSKISNAGTFTAAWDGCNDDGLKLESGIYFIRLHSGAADLVRRTILLK